jgi:hypothetical protein
MNDNEEARDILQGLMERLVEIDEQCDYADHVGWDDPNWRAEFADLRGKVQEALVKAALTSIDAQPAAKVKQP